MPMGLSTSIAAPVSERLRTVQLMLPPPKLIMPALRTRRRGATRWFRDALPDLLTF
jgi:hypothetical protein